MLGSQIRASDVNQRIISLQIVPKTDTLEKESSLEHGKA